MGVSVHVDLGTAMPVEPLHNKVYKDCHTLTLYGCVCVSLSLRVYL
jgi:hypothetical protein